MLTAPKLSPPGSELPVAFSTPLEQQRQQVAGDHAEHRAEDAEHEPLEPQRALELARGRPDGREHRELAQPLGDDHAERVVDDEPADQQGQDGERLQRPSSGSGRTTRSYSRWSSRNSSPVWTSNPSGTTVPAAATRSSGSPDPRR